MKIYLAAGMTVTNVKGRERELANKWKGRDWRGGGYSLSIGRNALKYQKYSPW